MKRLSSYAGKIVWYWHHNKKQWRKGKVIANYCMHRSTNPIGLFVKDRSSRKPFYVSRNNQVFLSSESKPSIIKENK